MPDGSDVQSVGAHRGTSLSRRFNYALLAIVFLILVIFAIVSIQAVRSRLNAEIEQRTALVASLAGRGMSTPLWNLDTEALTALIEAVFSSEDIVYVQLATDDGENHQRILPEFAHLEIGDLKASADFVSHDIAVTHDAETIGQLHLVWTKNRVKQQIVLYIQGIAGLTLLLLVAIAMTSWLVTRRHIARPLRALQSSAATIARGDLDAPIDEARNDEIGRLANTFNAMRESLKSLFKELSDTNDKLAYTNQNLEKLVSERTGELAAANHEITALNTKLRADNVRLGAEIDVTRRLQQMLLPAEHELKSIAPLDISGHMTPAEEVGGDYFDVLEHQGRIRIGIGDVTGHGLESGMVMLMTQMAIRTLLNAGETDARRFLDVTNQSIYDNVKRMETDKNLTLALLDYHDGTVRISGQHEEVIVVRGNGTIERVDTIDLGFPIGLERDIEAFLDQQTISLASGDGLVLFTDGVTEAADIQGVQYGIDRLCDVVLEQWHLSAESIKDNIVADVHAHIATQEIYDDLTLLVVKHR